MSHEPTLFIATHDLAGQTRGRSVPGTAEESTLTSGVGWVPANLAITPFGAIAPNVFGSTGDLRLLPDPKTRVTLPASEFRPEVTVMLADQVLPDGSPWACCPRTFARDALRDLKDACGLSVTASFEHEFMIRGLPATAPFSFARHRVAEPFGTELVTLLGAIGFGPENWLPEFGEDQFEITLEPTDALTAADRAILLREVTRDVAERHGHRTTFSPLVAPDGGGNGVHVHLSLRDADGVPVLYDAQAPGRLSDLGRRFAAGILTHAPALLAVTAPSVISRLRLTPHRWSAGGVFLAERNREALLRICPTSSLGDSSPEPQFNLEFRAADAAANPWLVLGVLIRAGLTGLAQEYAPATVWPETVTEAELAEVPKLATGLDESLAALEDDKVVTDWFDPALLDTHLSIKRAELELTADLSDAETCARYADVY